MNFKTNHEINQVTENILVIGIDISKHKHHYASHSGTQKLVIAN